LRWAADRWYTVGDSFDKVTADNRYFTNAKLAPYSALYRILYMVEQTLKVLKNTKLARGTYQLTLGAGGAFALTAGQFINIRIPGRAELLLKRPFCIASAVRETGVFTVCFVVTGKGTEQLSMCAPGDLLQADFPLGNGFTLMPSHKNVALVGGGAGIYPLLAACTMFRGVSFHTFLGFRSAEYVCLTQEFESSSQTFTLCTDDGSAGTKGFVTYEFEKRLKSGGFDAVLACGPQPMLAALQQIMRGYPHIYAQASVEERMGCGVGACLVCACAVQRGGKQHNLRACKDGPVFMLEELDFSAQNSRAHGSASNQTKGDTSCPT